jgi:hypothetical protein
VDRNAFLDTVADAVIVEDTCDSANKMISMLANGPYIGIIGNLLGHKDVEVRNKAFLALGNLIASNIRAVSSVATDIAIKVLSLIEAGIAVDATRNNAIYVASNIVRSRTSASLSSESRAKIATLLANEFNKDTHNPCVDPDLLYAIDHISAGSKVCPNKLFTTLSAPRAFKNKADLGKAALRILGDQMSDDFPATYHQDAYYTLRYVMLKHGGIVSDEVFTELLWVLSNLVVEPGMGLQFLKDDTFASLVCDAILTGCEGEVTPYAREAVWVVANAFKLVPDLDMIEEDQLTMFSDSLLVAQSSITNTTQQDLINETLNAITNELRIRNDDDVISVHSGSDMDIDYDEVPSLINTAEPGPVAAPVISIPAPAPAGNCFPPNAIDLLMGAGAYIGTSRAVFDLIKSLEMSDTRTAEIPDAFALTGSDLRALHALGYCVMNGRLAINPMITMAHTA